MAAQIAVEGPVDRRVEMAAAFIKMVQDKGKSFLNKTVTMDELAVPMHKPETKLQSMQ
jgi:hypothetical protein